MATYWRDPRNEDFVEGRTTSAFYDIPLDITRPPTSLLLAMIVGALFFYVAYCLHSGRVGISLFILPVLVPAATISLLFIRNGVGFSRVRRAVGGAVEKVEAGDDGDNPLLGISYQYEVGGRLYRGHHNHYDLKQGVPAVGDRVWVLCLVGEPATHALL